ncbi:molybdate ABC transporter substrate-binding protein [Kytococcus sp. Marseille-QA3725]
MRTPRRFPRTLPSRRSWGLAAVSVLTLAACGGPEPAGQDGSGADGEPTGEITVLAAASLTEAFEQIAADVERNHPGSDVRLSFGGSSALATQVTQGAPADVLATASTATMDTAVRAGAVQEPSVVARNRLTLAVPRGNPAGIDGVEDLAREEVRLATCLPEVPCGAAAQQLSDATGTTLHPVTQERDVKATLAKVRLGEVDAGLVYVTDARAADGAVDEVPLPEAPTTDYPLAVVGASANPALARAFVDAVQSDRGRAVLREAGFTTP